MLCLSKLQWELRLAGWKYPVEFMTTSSAVEQCLFEWVPVLLCEDAHMLMHILPLFRWSKIGGGGQQM